jgi:hypothetical protein
VTCVREFRCCRRTIHQPCRSTGCGRTGSPFGQCVSAVEWRFRASRGSQARDVAGLLGSPRRTPSVDERTVAELLPRLEWPTLTVGLMIRRGLRWSVVVVVGLLFLGVAGCGDGGPPTAEQRKRALAAGFDVDLVYLTEVDGCLPGVGGNGVYGDDDYQARYASSRATTWH